MKAPHEFKIENIDLRHVERANATKNGRFSFLRRMEVGQSIFISIDRDDFKSVQKGCYDVGRRLGMKMRQHTIYNEKQKSIGIRIGRVA